MAKDTMKRKHDMASNTTDTTTKITADETDKKQLQLHTHKVQEKSTCKFGDHDKRLACLEVEEYSGKGYDHLAEEFAGEGFSLRGARYRAGAKCVFS